MRTYISRFAFWLETIPQFHAAAHQNGEGCEKCQHEYRVNCIVAIKNLAKDNLAVFRAWKPTAHDCGTNPPDNKPDDCRNEKKPGQAPGAAHPFADN